MEKNGFTGNHILCYKASDLLNQFCKLYTLGTDYMYIGNRHWGSDSDVDSFIQLDLFRSVFIVCLIQIEVEFLRLCLVSF